MRKKRTPIMLVIALTLILSMVLAANAASKCPYGTRDAKCVNWTNPVQDHAYSYITRNTDLPVDNFLYVSMCVQYQEGNNFYWEPAYTDGGDDIEQARTDRWRYSIMANRTNFVAQAAGCDDYVEDVTAAPS